MGDDSLVFIDNWFDDHDHTKHVDRKCLKMDRIKAYMDKIKVTTDKLPDDLTMISTVEKSHYNVRWEVQNWKKIGGVISIPKFATATGDSKVWMVTLKSENKSLRVTLERLENDNRSIYVKHTMKILEITGEIRESVNGQDVICGKSTVTLGKFDNFAPTGDNLILEIHITVYGNNIETSSSSYDVQCHDLDLRDLKKDFSLMMNDPNADVTIHVGTETFSAHMFLLNCRTSEFNHNNMSIYEGHVHITLRGINPEEFRNLLTYIYTGDIDTDLSEINAAKMYRAAYVCGLKGLQRIYGKCLIERLSNDRGYVLEMAKACKDEELQEIVLRGFRQDI